MVKTLMAESWNVSPHFSWSEMTTTRNDELREKNALEAKPFISSIVTLANLLESIRTFVMKPIYVHSAFRCPELNGLTKGSSDKSQHMKGEAVDFTCMGESEEEEVRNLFNQCQVYLEKSKKGFGQLIFEAADRDYGRACWVHLSLGHPYRAKDRCGEIMEANNGKFTLNRRLG